jgi:hypothetical protein
MHQPARDDWTPTRRTNDPVALAARFYDKLLRA